MRPRDPLGYLAIDNGWRTRISEVGSLSVEPLFEVLLPNQLASIT
jgi:hypothetical protein